MSLWSDYRKERLGYSEIHEEGKGFLSYELNPPIAVVHDLYIAPIERRSNLALSLMNKFTALARDGGCTEIRTQVVVGTIGLEKALRANLAYGFKVIAAQGDYIILKKDIGG